MNRGVLIAGLVLVGLVPLGLAGCAPSLSPDTYASNAAQQANKVEQGVVIGMRKVEVSASATVGTVTGAAAGGIAGSQVGVGPTSAFAALGGSLVGGIAGSTMEHITGDTPAFEYIVRKGNGDLISVTQKDRTPLALGQKVLVISGNQARVVPDYTVPPETVGVKPAASAVATKPVAPIVTAKPVEPAMDPKPVEPAVDAKPVEPAKPETPSADAKPDDKPPLPAAALQP